MLKSNNFLSFQTFSWAFLVSIIFYKLPVSVRNILALSPYLTLTHLLWKLLFVFLILIWLLQYFIIIDPLGNCFSLQNFVLNNHFKYSFLLALFFTSVSFIGFSVDLPNIALFLILEFCLLLSFSACFHNSVLRSIHGFRWKIVWNF